MLLLQQSLFQAVFSMIGALLCAVGALLYFQRVRLERPAIGVFNTRDVVIVGFFILVLPFLYVLLPLYVVTGLLILTFAGASYIALSPLLPARIMWPAVAAFIVADIFVTNEFLGTTSGWQLYWVINSAIVLVAAIGVSNLYVQGGMRFRHVAWFIAFLTVYDAFFSLVVPISVRLADTFEGRPLDPAVGFRMWAFGGDVGLGDLLVFGLFTIAAYKAYGRKGAIASMIAIPIFGAFIPGMVPMILSAFVRQGIGIVVPVQAIFGPVAIAIYYWLSRSGPERSMAEWYKVQDAAGHQIVRVRRPVRARPAIAGNAN